MLEFLNSVDTHRLLVVVLFFITASPVLLFFMIYPIARRFVEALIRHINSVQGIRDDLSLQVEILRQHTMLLYRLLDVVERNERRNNAPYSYPPSDRSDSSRNEDDSGR